MFSTADSHDLFFFPLFGSIFCLNRLGFTDALQD